MSEFVSGIDHIEINVHDLDASVAFFKKAGFVETRRTDHTGGSVELRFPGGPDAPILELNASDDEPKGFQHIAMRAIDIDKAYADYVERGFQFIRPLQDKPTLSGRRVFNLMDPEGKKLQISTRID
ncbi:VOC family protein [uncultured Paracoccus sp.]|uniref:VOC family protein n=1 Tax=uncultured Paracoccus sp. TaxID=189685 RepID=UPI0025FB27E6|nr:VOC family protein [uncultured Paracoccus sp.]